MLDTAGPRASATGAAPLRRWLVTAAWVAAALAGFAAYLRLARTRPVNSDGASQALQAWDMLHGNALLHGWTLTDVSFYTTELPEYMLVELARGLGQDVVHVAAALTYTLAVLFAALLAKGTATGREAAVRVALAAGIMLAPQLVAGTNVLISSPDHVGTSVPLLAVWLILDRARPRWYVPVITSLLLAVAQIGDTLVVFAGVVPLILVCGFRAIRGAAPAGQPRSFRARLAAQWYDLALAGGAAVAGVAGQLAPRVIHAVGGYTVHPVNTQVAPLGEIIKNLPVIGRGLLLLTGADFIGLPAGTTTTLFVMLHAATAIVVNVAVFAVSAHVAGLPSAREIAPVLPFAAALAGRELARPLTSVAFARRVVLPVLGVVLAGYLVGLGLEISKPSVPPQASQLTSWLERHHLGTGLSGYWEANVVTLTSGGRAAVRLAETDGVRVIQRGSNLNAAWYDPARSSADFVVLFPGIDGFPGFTSRKEVLATFGKPARTYHVGRYTILYWHKNLLTDLRRPPS